MLKYFKGSPLWLIGLFVLFAEATSAIAAVKLDGWPQQALVIFVIAYATVVTAIFFLFLWFKPENFYAPSDYGDVSPESYVKALRGLPSETINAVVNLEDNPFDQDALFALMDALVPEETKQHLILVSKLGGILDVSNADERGNTHTYEIITRNKGISFGVFSPREFLRNLDGTQLVTPYDNHSKIKLTARGEKFASWLLEHDKGAESFWSEKGGWGERRNLADVLKERFPQNIQHLQNT